MKIIEGILEMYYDEINELFRQIIQYRRSLIMYESLRDSRNSADKCTYRFLKYKSNISFKKSFSSFNYKKAIKLKGNDLQEKKEQYGNILNSLKWLIQIIFETEDDEIVDSIFKKHCSSFRECIPNYTRYYYYEHWSTSIVSLRYLTRLEPIKIEKISDLIIKESWEKVTRDRACILLSCKPLHETLDLLHEFHEFSLKKSKIALIDLEKLLYRNHTIDFNRKNIIATAIKIANPRFTYNRVRETIQAIGPPQETSIRSCFEFYNSEKKKHLMKKYIISYKTVINFFEKTYSIKDISELLDIPYKDVKNILLLENKPKYIQLKILDQYDLLKGK